MSFTVNTDRSGLVRMRIDGAYVVRTRAGRLAVSQLREPELIDLRANDASGPLRSYYLEHDGYLYWPEAEDVNAVQVGEFQGFRFQQLEMEEPVGRPVTLRASGRVIGGKGVDPIRYGGVFGVAVRSGTWAVRSCVVSPNGSALTGFVRIGKDLGVGMFPARSAPFSVQGERAAIADSGLAHQVNPPVEAFWNGTIAAEGQAGPPPQGENAEWAAVESRRWRVLGSGEMVTRPVVLSPGGWFAFDFQDSQGWVRMELEQLVPGWRP